MSVIGLFYTGYPRVDIECHLSRKDMHYVRKGHLVIPEDAVLEVKLNGKKLYGRVSMNEDEKTRGLKIGEDCYLDGPLTEDENTYKGNETISLGVYAVSPGGGPVNKAIATNRFLQSIHSDDEEVLFRDRLKEIHANAVLLNSSDFIHRCILPAGYYPLEDCNGIGYNINVHLGSGSINIRHRDPEPGQGYKIKGASTNRTNGERGDFVVLDSMQSTYYSEFLRGMFRPLDEKRVVLSATDTMTKNLSEQELNLLLSHSEFFTSNLDEFRRFCRKTMETDDGTPINSWEEFYACCRDVGAQQKNGRSLLYITLGEHGGVLYRDGKLWFQPTKLYRPELVFSEHELKTTVKLGDTVAGTAIPAYIAGYPAELLLIYGNTAGQMRAETKPEDDVNCGIGKLIEFMYGMEDVVLYNGFGESFVHAYSIKNNHHRQ